ncbi:MAG: NUDIX hydrolase [Anaerolineales bacterium]|nr:NUDIX hydrolase [Anaerolineales bacterium]
MSAKPFDETSEVNFCLRCGSPLSLAQRFGRLRPACPACGWFYFADPKVAVAALIERDGKVLLVRRANDPQRGLWTLPAGFVDAGEDPVSALERECREETGLQVHVTELLDVVNGQEHPRGAHILIVYRAEVLSGQARAHDDVDRVAFFPRDDLPPLAFSTTRKIILT